MPEHILAIDQGTTSTRAIVFDSSATPVASAQVELSQHFPQPGWVEHDPIEIAEAAVSVAKQAISRANLAPGDIAAIGIANQRETTIVWERSTGRPLANAIVWQARRTAEGVSLRPEDLPPRCPGCGGVEKPDVVLFGEMIPAGVLEETTRLIDHCEVWIVAGTSAQVQPAALVPFHARLRGAKVFEFNLEPLLDQAHGRVLGDVAETLPALLQML